MATFSRTVTVDWAGSIMEGKGVAKAGSGAFTLPVTFPSRIGEPAGKTSPEELMAASHAACYAMALNATLGRKGGSAARTVVSATVSADKTESGIKLTVIEAEGRRGRAAGDRGVAVQRGREGGRSGVPDFERAPRARCRSTSTRR